MPGTDSYRHKAAGAYGTVVYSEKRFCLVKEETGHQAADFFGYFNDADLILLEGMKDSAYPKIEVMRREVSKRSVCKKETVKAYVTDFLPGLFEETEDYTEMLLNISFTNEDDVIRMLVDGIVQSSPE